MKNYIIYRITKKCIVFEGRASRKEYIIFSLTYFFLLFTSYCYANIIEKYDSLLLIHGIFLLFMLTNNFAITCRRLHDLNISGWWQIIPIVGSIFISKIITILVFIVLIILKGTHGSNIYGEQPD